MAYQDSRVVSYIIDLFDALGSTLIEDEIHALLQDYLKAGDLEAVLEDYMTRDEIDTLLDSYFIEARLEEHLVAAVLAILIALFALLKKGGTDGEPLDAEDEFEDDGGPEEETMDVRRAKKSLLSHCGDGSVGSQEISV